MRTQTLISALCLFVPLQIAYGQQAEAPVYKDGDWWVFRVKGGTNPGEYRVDYKNDKFESDDPNFLTAALLISVHLSDPQKKWFDFPLVPGKKWSFRYQHTGAVSRRLEWRDSEAKVIGPATVETPAGKLNAIEIQRTDFSIARFDLVYFYSPQTKSVVKLKVDTSGPRDQQQFEMELVKYSVSR